MLDKSKSACLSIELTTPMKPGCVHEPVFNQDWKLSKAIRCKFEGILRCIHGSACSHPRKVII